jgi:hypothetical protein
MVAMSETPDQANPETGQVYKDVEARIDTRANSPLAAIASRFVTWG